MKGMLVIDQGPSTLSLIAAAGYGVVTIACLGAAWSVRWDHPDSPRTIGWILIGAFFALLLVARLLSLEEILRDDLREWLRARGGYEGRRTIQLPLAVSVAMAGMAALAWSYRRWKRLRGRRDKAFLVAQAGAAAMLVLILLRTISFSAFDKLLYGPLKLNWVGDIGAALLVLGAALFYIRVARDPAR